VVAAAEDVEEEAVVIKALEDAISEKAAAEAADLVVTVASEVAASSEATATGEVAAAAAMEVAAAAALETLVEPGKPSRRTKQVIQLVFVESSHQGLQRAIC
jgi:hypothetical protein